MDLKGPCVSNSLFIIRSAAVSYSTFSIVFFLRTNKIVRVTKCESSKVVEFMCVKIVGVTIVSYKDAVFIIGLKSTECVV